jgi:hypothetical protein
MNAERRKELDKVFGLIEEAKSILENVAGEEQDAFDNLPEGLQQAERGQAMEEAVSALNDAEGELENALANIETAKGD